eukprot:GHVT01089300.1.p1 GENE.GHVT01089300.1~~GHVT01089300.1.p1  ORF type:complete len:466 (-),score=33.33 GHVT01089300.1:492-1889(-)
MWGRRSGCMQTVNQMELFMMDLLYLKCCALLLSLVFLNASASVIELAPSQTSTPPPAQPCGIVSPSFQAVPSSASASGTLPSPEKIKQKQDDKPLCSVGSPGGICPTPRPQGKLHAQNEIPPSKKRPFRRLQGFRKLLRKLKTPLTIFLCVVVPIIASSVISRLVLMLSQSASAKPCADTNPGERPAPARHCIEKNIELTVEQRAKMLQGKVRHFHQTLSEAIECLELSETTNYPAEDIAALIHFVRHGPLSDMYNARVIVNEQVNRLLRQGPPGQCAAQLCVYALFPSLENSIVRDALQACAPAIEPAPGLSLTTYVDATFTKLVTLLDSLAKQVVLPSRYAFAYVWAVSIYGEQLAPQKKWLSLLTTENEKCGADDFAANKHAHFVMNPPDVRNLALQIISQKKQAPWSTIYRVLPLKYVEQLKNDVLDSDWKPNDTYSVRASRDSAPVVRDRSDNPNSDLPM